MLQSESIISEILVVFSKLSDIFLRFSKSFNRNFNLHSLLGGVGTFSIFLSVSLLVDLHGLTPEMFSMYLMFLNTTDLASLETMLARCLTSLLLLLNSFLKKVTYLAHICFLRGTAVFARQFYQTNPYQIKPIKSGKTAISTTSTMTLNMCLTKILCYAHTYFDPKSFDKTILKDYNFDKILN